MKKLAVVLVLTLALVFVVSAVGHVVDAKGPPDHAQNDKKDTDTGNGNGNGNGNGGNGIGNGPPHTPPGPPETPPGQILVCVQHKKGWPIKWHPKHAVGPPWTVVDDSLCENGGDIPDDPDDDDPGGDDPDEDIPVEVTTSSGTFTVYVSVPSKCMLFEKWDVVLSYKDQQGNNLVGVFTPTADQLTDSYGIPYDLSGAVFGPDGCKVYAIAETETDTEIVEITWDLSGNPTSKWVTLDRDNQGYLVATKTHLYYSTQVSLTQWDLYRVRYKHWDEPELVKTNARNPAVSEDTLVYESGSNLMMGSTVIEGAAAPRYDQENLYYTKEGGFFLVGTDSEVKVMSGFISSWDFTSTGILGVSDNLLMEYPFNESTGMFEEGDLFREDILVDFVDVFNFNN